MAYFAGGVELAVSFLMTHQPTPPAPKTPVNTPPPGDICKPVSCGPLPPLKYTSFEPAVQGEVFYGGESFLATCDRGYTVGGIAGGSMYFYVTCEANGEFFGVDSQCMPAGYSVTGVVNDAKSAKILIGDAKVECSQNGAVVDTAYSNSGGRYTVSVGEGIYTVT